MLWGPPEGLWGLGIVSAQEGALDEALRHAGALDALARPRGMRGFLARAGWVQAQVARARGGAFDVSETLTLARESAELPLLRSLLALTGSAEAAVVTEAMAGSIPDPTLRGRFLSAAGV